MPRYSDPAASRWFSFCPACVVGDCAHCQPVPWCECTTCLPHDLERPDPHRSLTFPEVLDALGLSDDDLINPQEAP